MANAIKGGVSTIGAALSDPKAGGAFALKSLATALGCETRQPSGYTGPIVPPITGNPLTDPEPCGGLGTSR